MTVDTSITGDPEARALLRRAHDGGNPEGFGGFNAKLTWSVGDTTAEADVTVLNPRQVEGSYCTQELALRRAVMPHQSPVQFAFTAWDVVMMGRAPHGSRSRWVTPGRKWTTRRSSSVSDTANAQEAGRVGSSGLGPGKSTGVSVAVSLRGRRWGACGRYPAPAGVPDATAPEGDSG